MIKNYLIFIIALFVSCKEETDKRIIYKKETKDVLFYENSEIKNQSAKELFLEGLEDVESEDFQDAKEKFREADEIEGNNPVILNAIAQTEFSLGNKELSNEITQKVLSIDSTHISAYINLGQNYLRERKYQEAKEILEKGRKFIPRENLHVKSVLFVNLAIAYNNLGDCNNGLKYSTAAVQISQSQSLTEFALKIKSESENKCIEE